MKTMILTGLGSEQRFTSNGEGETLYYLVFNEGELRVQIPEEAAHVVVKHMYGGQSPEQEEPGNEGMLSVPEPGYESDTGSDEDGIDQI
jgi:hypothetical protein